MKQIPHDRANAPTEALIQRQYHRIATLGRNQIIRDHYRTQYLKGNERVTSLLPKTKRPRRTLNATLNGFWKIFGFLNQILATREEISK